MDTTEEGYDDDNGEVRLELDDRPPLPRPRSGIIGDHNLPYVEAAAQAAQQQVGFVGGGGRGVFVWRIVEA